MKWAIIKRFSVKNKNCFRYQDVLREFPEKDPSYLSKVINAMVSKGMLLKVFRDVYYIIPLSANPENYIPESFQVAKGIMNEEGYYIAYSSAMYIHGITDLTRAKIWIATEYQRKPSKLHFKGTEVHFITLSYDRFFGYQEMWISNQETAMVSDLEKTIVDAATKPQLCGGILGFGKAINRSKESTELEKLFYYFARNGCHAATKRYLFLSHILELDWTPEHGRMLENSGASFSLLDPSGPKQGKKNSRFGLKLNVDLSTLKKTIVAW
jgi:predicted transcriptional regulator of viral defense system